MTASPGAAGPQPLPALEPVHLGAHLTRTPGVAYTEVGGQPVLCQPTERRLHPVAPAFAAIWARLDGGTLADAVRDAIGTEATQVGTAAHRATIEAVRRAKAAHLVSDVPHAETTRWTAPPLPTVAPPPEVLVVHGTLHGKCLALDTERRTRTGVVTLDAHAPDLAPHVGETRITSVAHVRTTEAQAQTEAPEEPSDALAVLAWWVEAVAEPDALCVPGTLDALALLAEAFAPRQDQTGMTSARPAS